MPVSEVVHNEWCEKTLVSAWTAFFIGSIDHLLSGWDKRNLGWILTFNANNAKFSQKNDTEYSKMQLSTVLIEQTGPHCLGIRFSHKPNVLFTEYYLSTYSVPNETERLMQNLWKHADSIPGKPSPMLWKYFGARVTRAYRWLNFWLSWASARAAFMWLFTENMNFTYKRLGISATLACCSSIQDLVRSKICPGIIKEIIRSIN